MKFEPNTTQTPNWIFDAMKDLESSEYLILMVIVRKTYGWHKERDRISLSQFQKMTGLSKPQIIKSIRSLLTQGYIDRDSEYTYAVVNSVDQTSKLSIPLASKLSLHTKETNKKTNQKREPVEQSSPDRSHSLSEKSLGLKIESPTQTQRIKTNKIENSLQSISEGSTEVGNIETADRKPDPPTNRTGKVLGLSLDEVLADFGTSDIVAVKKKPKSVALVEVYGGTLEGYNFGRETLHYNRLVKKYGELETELLLHKLKAVKSGRKNWDVPIKWSSLSEKMIVFLKGEL